MKQLKASQSSQQRTISSFFTKKDVRPTLTDVSNVRKSNKESNCEIKDSKECKREIIEIKSVKSPEGIRSPRKKLVNKGKSNACSRSPVKNDLGDETKNTFPHSQDEPDDPFIPGNSKKRWTDETVVQNSKKTKLSPNDNFVSSQEDSKKTKLSPNDNFVSSQENSRTNNKSEGFDSESQAVSDILETNIDLLSEDISFFSDPFDEEVVKSSFDLTESQRCRVLQVERLNTETLRVTLKRLEDSSVGECKFLFPWSELRVKEGDIMSVQAEETSEGWVASESTPVVIHSDLLISGTSVVGSLFCTRRSVLQHLFKEVAPSTQASAMFVGIIVHELLQQSLKKGLTSKEEIESLYEEVVTSKDFLRKVYFEDMDPEQLTESIASYLPRIVDFIQKYINPTSRQLSGDDWGGEICEVRDIEENIWAPRLGIKGKVDATVQVRIHKKTKVMPLELKTGKASFSPEHRGQVMLYCMLLNELQLEADSGLLLYLKESKMKEIRGGVVEKRDLLMLRNELASRLVESSRVSSANGSPRLPPVIWHHSACARCSQLTLCSVALKKEGTVLSEDHPLVELSRRETAHLSDSHIEYMLKWLSMVLIESAQASTRPLWAVSLSDRAEEGSCLRGLDVEGEVKPEGNKYLVRLASPAPIKQGVVTVGQFVIVSSDTQVAVAMGTVQEVAPSSVLLFLERDVSKLKGPLHVDRYSSNSSSSLTCGFLSYLMENSQKGDFLRSFIIDMKVPSFSKKLSSRVKLAGKEVFGRLNRDQVRVILQVLSADSYIIVKGMPGTGKTTCLAGLVEVLTKLGLSVLVVSHTHLAVDNILMKLSDGVKAGTMRLGPASRVHPTVAHLCEQTLLAESSYSSIKQLDQLYTSKKVYGVTCLGAGHNVLKKKFDYCLVDEATQVCQPETLAALASAAKFVLIGDPNQLPPLVISEQAKELGMGVSLLERLDRPAVTALLTTQYRMNQRIMDLANSFAYEGLLRCADERVASATLSYPPGPSRVSSWLGKVTSSQLKDSVVVVHVPPDPSSCHTVNRAEADLVLRIISTFKEVGIKGDDIGVISPYRGQVSLISSEVSTVLDSVEVNTVDQYQGRDKSIIIYSATRNKPKGPSYDIVSDKNRLTVAVTRAKHKLIILADTDSLSSYPHFQSIFQFIGQHNFVNVSDK